MITFQEAVDAGLEIREYWLDYPGSPDAVQAEVKRLSEREERRYKRKNELEEHGSSAVVVVAWADAIPGDPPVVRYRFAVGPNLMRLGKGIGVLSGEDEREKSGAATSGEPSARVTGDSGSTVTYGCQET